MSKLEKLIQELCPDGVECVELGAVCKIKTGESVNQLDIQRNPGKYPVINSGREPLGFINKWNTKNDPIGITTRGAGVGSITWCEKKYFRGNLNYSVTIINDREILQRFLYHLLLQSQVEIQKLATYTGIPALNASNLVKLIIPIPPLPIQEEIVRILDTFTALEAELEAELEKRKKQYEYYRNELLCFDEQAKYKGKLGQLIQELCPDGVKHKMLGEIGRVAMCKRIMKAETTPDGNVPFYKIGTFGKVADAYISAETYERYKRDYSFPHKGDILISAAGTIGRAVIYDGDPAYYQDSNIVWLEHDESQVMNKYLYYCYQLSPWHISTGGTIARLYNDNINKAKIPLPPLPVQKEIVGILDRFDALVNDISQGLPAEIAARRKQYEYYRDKLLTFKCKEAVA